MTKLTLGVLAPLAFLVSCASIQEIDNIQATEAGFGYQATYRSPEDAAKRRKVGYVSKFAGCESGVGIAAGKTATRIHVDPERLTPGDLVAVAIAEDDTFTGRYEVSQDGTLKLPYIDPIVARGRTVTAIERAVAQALVKAEFFKDAPRVSVRVADFAAARVFVSGAVFNPNAVVVGAVAGNQVDRVRQEALGGIATSRRLSAALQAAGGVRPDADLKQVKVIRDGQTLVVDLRPAIFGRPFQDMILLNDDQVEVKSLECFQRELVKPTSITPPGIRVFLSNLSQPADANALSAISDETTSLPYGTRFLQGLFAMNCFGGAKLTNANRVSVLLTRDPVTGYSVALERDIEELLRRPDRDDFNPFLMPGDALACYDSRVISVKELAAAVTTIASPALIFRPLE